jgi:hypothetical protein
MKRLLSLCLLTVFVTLSVKQSQAQSAYFYPEGTKLDMRIPSPSSFLGYQIGEWHTRHDRIVAYFQKLAEVSDRATIQLIGHTNEKRDQVVLTITSPANHARLDEIRRNHLLLSQPGKAPSNLEDMPAIILLGHNVHGNESSGAEAAMLEAYYYVANTDPEIIKYLDEAVIMIDPSFNPDGRDRHANWANMHKGFPPVADPIDREHNEVWPGGRSNHYWFDLNRDWFPLAHVESRNRVRFFHGWRPNVLTDYHEMGTNSTYFFEPTKPFGSENPVVPRSNYEVLNVVLANYFAKALDEIGSLYFSKEQFDNSYVGYGSTYPDIHGGLGLVFEQASSRGHVQRSSTGDVTFAFTIRNQLRTALATVKGTVENRLLFHKHMKEFYETALTEADRNPVKGYVFGDKDDFGKTNKFLDMLLAHQIEVYKLERDFQSGNQKFALADAYFVPHGQAQYRMVRSVFENVTSFYDSAFYDASSWSMANSYNMPYAEVRGSSLATSNRVLNTPSQLRPQVKKSDYAYVFEWKDYNAPKALRILNLYGVITQVATKPLKIQTQESGEMEFGYGSISIPVQFQTLEPEKLYDAIIIAATYAQIPIYSVNTGFSKAGVDLGSGSIVTLNPPKVLMVIGQGTTSTEAGEIWYLLDSELSMPITKVDAGDIGRVNWDEFNTLILVSGSYNFGENNLNRLKQWIREGGNLIAVKGAVNWAISNGIASEKYVEGAGYPMPVRGDYANASNFRGPNSIGGVMFATDLDITHPLAYGYTRRYLPVYRNHSTMIQPSANPFNTVAKYTQNPLLSGYISGHNLNKLKGSASLLVAGSGRGKVIMFVDNPNFRGTWFGTNKLFFNALFFGGIINANP